VSSLAFLHPQPSPDFRHTAYCILVHTPYSPPLPTDVSIHSREDQGIDGLRFCLFGERLGEPHCVTLLLLLTHLAATAGTRIKKHPRAQSSHPTIVHLITTDDERTQQAPRVGQDIGGEQGGKERRERQLGQLDSTVSVIAVLRAGRSSEPCISMRRLSQTVEEAESRLCSSFSNPLRRSITAVPRPVSPSYRNSFPNASTPAIPSVASFIDGENSGLPPSRFKILPREEEGREELPPYTCSLHREAMFERKMELQSRE